MKYFIVLFTLFSFSLNAQGNLSFDKRFVESEDKWVAFQKDKDNNYAYGFIYIDEQAGLTLNYEGTFKISTKNEFIPEKIGTASIKYRLEANQVKVAFIPKSKFPELNINETPEWLKYYKTDTLSVKRLYRWGFLYNGWGECQKALTYLKKAQKIDPHYNALEVELAYSYNCIGQYENTITVLKSALKNNPNDAYTNKELIFAQIKSDQLDQASESCLNAIEKCSDTKYNGENIYNLLYSYYRIKDKDGFSHWINKAKKWNKGKENFMESIKAMENDLKI